MDQQQRDAITLALQRGLPLCPRPFARMAEGLGVSETSVLQCLRELRQSGVGRRFGGIFDSNRLGTSMLCAIDSDVPAQIAQQIRDRVSITHCYQRSGRPALWFTVTTAAHRQAEELAVIESLAGCPLLLFPMQQRFKIGVVIDPTQGSIDPQPLAALPDTPALIISEEEQRLVALLQGDLALQADVFTDLAQRWGSDEEDLLRRLSKWQAQGLLRRIALVCRHRRMGLQSNAMVVWRIPEQQIFAAGQWVAASSQVSHCYQRRPPEHFPFNLFAMLHAGSAQELEQEYQRLDQGLGRPESKILYTRSEWKKSSPQLFADSLLSKPDLGRPRMTRKADD